MPELPVTGRLAPPGGATVGGTAKTPRVGIDASVVAGCVVEVGAVVEVAGGDSVVAGGVVVVVVAVDSVVVVQGGAGGTTCVFTWLEFVDGFVSM